MLIDGVPHVLADECHVQALLVAARGYLDVRAIAEADCARAGKALEALCSLEPAAEYAWLGASDPRD